jgi:DnaJ-domain-containing protein 1
MSITEFVSKNFIRIQVIIFIAGIFIWFRYLQGGEQERSKFRVREADRTDLNRLREGPGLADAKLQKKNQTPPPQPLSLPGIRLVGEPHEILGVKEDASEAEVMKAYKDSIKRFHPDRIQGEAKEQMYFYEQASAKINQAKEDMLKNIRSKRA